MPRVSYHLPSERLLLADDNGEDDRSCLGVGERTTIENSWIRLDCDRARVSGGGLILTVQWPVAFRRRAVGKHFRSYLLARDRGGKSSGWQHRGDWSVVDDGFRPDGGIGEDDGGTIIDPIRRGARFAGGGCNVSPWRARNHIVDPLLLILFVALGWRRVRASSRK